MEGWTCATDTGNIWGEEKPHPLLLPLIVFTILLQGLGVFSF